MYGFIWNVIAFCSILSLHGKIRVRENPYPGIFYSLFVSLVIFYMKNDYGYPSFPSSELLPLIPFLVQRSNFKSTQKLKYWEFSICLVKRSRFTSRNCKKNWKENASWVIIAIVFIFATNYSFRAGNVSLLNFCVICYIIFTS